MTEEPFGNRNSGPSLSNADIHTHDIVSRRMALSTFRRGATAALAIVLGISRASASDTGDNDQNSVADYKWRSNSDSNTYGDTTQTDASEDRDVTDSDQTVAADEKSTPDSDVRHVADRRDRD